MIDKKDLRLGNWVLDEENKPMQVIEISEYAVNHREQYGCVEESHSLDNINGINLTEEILLKCGFEEVIEERIDVPYMNSSNTVWKVYKKKHLKFSCQCTEGLSFQMQLSFNDVIVVLTELHDLQNLYFVLTGEELEVKL